jgi:hypothetical protein
VLERTLALAYRESHEMLVEREVALGHAALAKQARYRYGCAVLIVTLKLQLPAHIPRLPRL